MDQVNICEDISLESFQYGIPKLRKDGEKERMNIYILPEMFVSRG